MTISTGTAIVSAAAMLNGLKVVGRKKIEEIKVRVFRSSPPFLLNLWCELGVARDITVFRFQGCQSCGREADVEATKPAVPRTASAPGRCDGRRRGSVFLGLSAAGVLNRKWSPASTKSRSFSRWLTRHRKSCGTGRAVRPDASSPPAFRLCDHVNNVLCFPFIFRGALDVGATRITEEMKMASVRAIAELAEAEVTDEVAMAYPGHDLSFGPKYLIAKPFDRA